MRCVTRTLCGSGLIVFAAAAGLTRAATKQEIRIDLDQAPTTRQTAPTKPAPAAPNASKAAAPAKKADKKKDDAPAKIEGMEISRGERGYLGLKLDGGTFKLSFYGPDKKPMNVDVSSAVLRWPVHYQPNDERAMLSPSSDGKSLTSAKIVRAPYTFKLYITLLQNGPSGETTAQEEYVVDFSQ